MSRHKHQQRVVVFGAGIAGLTAAHELVDRGFHVDVYERDPNDGQEPGPAIGGMARSQWCYLPVPYHPGRPVPPALGILVDRLRDLVRENRQTFEATAERQVQGGAVETFVSSEAILKLLDPLTDDLVTVLAEGADFDQLDDDTFPPNLDPAVFSATAASPRPAQIEDRPYHCVDMVSMNPDNRDLPEDDEFSMLRQKIRIVSDWMRAASPAPTCRVEIRARAFHPKQQVRKMLILRLLLVVIGILLWKAHEKLGDPPENPADWTDEKWDDFLKFLARFTFIPVDGSTAALWENNDDSRLAVHPEISNAVVFTARQCELPGEHGFRFFPSFYRHVFDTMQRTPVTWRTRADHEYPSGTTYDNLVATGALGIGVKADPANARRRSFIVERRMARSVEELRDFFDEFRSNLDHSARDGAHMGAATLKYLTSCRERREGEYEHVSWSDFAELDRMTPLARRDLDRMPAVIAALNGSQSDARSQGSISLQLIFDQFTDGSRSDGTLNGPTSNAWFRHWRAHLERLGVAFHKGELTDFKGDRVKGVTPVVTVSDVPREMAPAEAYVLALDLPGAAKLRAPFLAAAKKAGVAAPDFEALGGFIDADGLADDLAKAEPTGPLQHLSGVQYFFRGHVRFPEAHMLYVDLPWGLTSISQRQFWRSQRSDDDVIATVLSVDIAVFHAKGLNKKTAWECTDQELAEEVWKQIRETLKGGVKGLPSLPADGKVENPVAYWVDRNIPFDRARGRRSNATPFLVNRTSEYQKRPGVPGDYKVNAGKYVLCGTFMRTWTRVTSMESANESARHAVNALLFRDPARTRPDGPLSFEGDLCRVWSPEDHELPDANRLKELDKKLWDEGAPHAMDILGVDALIDRVFPSTR